MKRHEDMRKPGFHSTATSAAVGNTAGSGWASYLDSLNIEFLMSSCLSSYNYLKILNKLKTDMKIGSCLHV